MNECYKICTDKSLLDFDYIHGFLSQAYWSKGIPRNILSRAIENSLCYGIYTDNFQQVGFARIVSDYATFAYLADVFVDENYRGKGLAKRMVRQIVANPDLQGLRRMLLATKDAHELYHQFGFDAPEKPETLMEICLPDIYQR